jgi:nitrate reductase gamma subunit
MFHVITLLMLLRHVLMLLHGCAWPPQILEQLTKFGVVRMAITGEAFMDACAGATRILVNNLLDTVRPGLGDG